MGIPRKLLASVLSLLALSVGAVLFLGTSPVGSFLTNVLQLVSCGLAVALALAASRRGRGLSRPFWIFVAASTAIWAIANLGWMYYENLLLQPVPRTSVVRVLFDIQCVFYAVALSLDKDSDSPEFNAELLLDCLQILIVFLSIFYGMFYAQYLENVRLNELILAWTFLAISGVLSLTAAAQAYTAKSKRIRTLYGGLAIFLLIFSIGAGIAESPAANRVGKTGSWFDLGWTVPFLIAALWAGSWREDHATERLRPRPLKTFTELGFKNFMLALPPLVVLLLVARLGTHGILVGYFLLAASIFSYVARLSITEFRQSLSADAVSRNRVAMESAVDGMAILNVEGLHVYANSAFARMVGLQNASSVIGKSWRDIYDKRDLALLEDQVRGSILQSGRWYGQLTLHRPDGSSLPIEMAITAMPQGGTVCVARNITDRIAAEHARAEAELKYRTLIEQVNAISYIADLGIEGQWFYVSPQVETILGFTPEEWLAGSRDWVCHVPQEDHHIIQAAEDACLRGEPFSAEYRVTRKDGKVIWVSDSAVVVRGSHTHPVMEGLIVDITDRKLLENQLQQSRRMEAVGRLAGGIAHDFNNLLTIIKGYAEIALNRPDNSSALNGDLQQIGSASERASTLIRQLLAFSRKQVLQPRSLDLNAIVEGLDKLLNRLMGANIHMTTKCAPDIGTVKADPVQLEQVIMNLVVNARDAMPEGGRLTIETANVELDTNYARDHVSVKPGPYVMLAVSDTGVGIDAETQAHIFEPFYTTKGGGRGTGLGLSTVYGIVKQSGGYIWVYSELGKGSAFKVYLPRVQEPVATTPAKPEGAEDRRGSETILIAEDEEAVRELAQTILTRQGYTVLTAKSAAEAEKIVASGASEIHLLLTDVVMPGESGRELAQRIAVRNPKIQVLFMSGYTDNVIAQGGVLDAGVAFLQKPFTPRALAAKVRDLLDRAAVASKK